MNAYEEMSDVFFYEGMTCAVCGRTFAANDDIVSCPTCGLPHHRTCWEKTGHCHLEALHGTPQQWSREQAQAEKAAADGENQTAGPTLKRCGHCGTANPQFAEFCQHCGCSLNLEEPRSEQTTEPHSGFYSEYKPFFASEPTPRQEEEPIEGYAVEDLSALVGMRREYYLPRFRRISRSGSGGWNWASFIFGGYWLLYRKMYWYGSGILLLNLLQSVVTFFVFARLDIKTYADVYRFTEMALTDKTYFLYFLSMWLMSVIILASKVLLGALGNRLYLYHCDQRIRRARLRTPDLEPSELAPLGGTSAVIAATGYAAFYILSQIIAVFMQ